MRRWRFIREKLLFLLSLAFALLFCVGMGTVLFTDADVLKTAVPPYLGFCFVFPLWKKNRKQQDSARENGENK